MQILSLTLKNFKSHSDRFFEFQLGTNAICGENGAGKTSILEAIAWTLFNYRGSYKNEDLIRNGTASAQVTVTLVSSRDGRTYEVQRCTSKGYTLYDPQLGERLPYRHIDDEVMPWLREHLGVSPETDLGKLFANTIGVPQGTFAVDFLQPPDQRKRIFDTILKVEEYRQANQQGLSLEKYAKAQVEKLEQAIAQYEEALQSWDDLQQQHQDLTQEIAADTAALATLQTEIANLQVERDRISAQIQQIQQLDTQLQALTTQIAVKQQGKQRLEQSLERARQAVQTCEQSHSGYQAYLQTEAELQALDQHLKQRQALVKQRDEKRRILADRHQESARLTVQLENLETAQATLTQLAPLVQQQQQLEAQQTAINETLQQFQTLQVEQQSLEKQRATLQTEGDRLTQTIEHLQALEASVRHIPAWEQQRDRLQEQLSHVEAARQFEAGLRQLVTTAETKRDRHQTQAEEALAVLRDIQSSVPLLATASVEAALEAIQSGVELNLELLTALQQILQDLSAQTSAAQLRQQLQQIKSQLDAAYRQQAEFATLPAQIRQRHQIQHNLTQLQVKIEQLQTQLGETAAHQAVRSQLAAQLQELGDPQGQCRLLAKDLKQQAAVQAAYERAQHAQAVIQQAIDTLEGQLAEFAEVEAQVEAQKQLRQRHQTDYLTYLQNQPDAKSLPGLEQEQTEAIAQLQSLERDRSAVQAQYEQLIGTYDPQQWQQVEATYQDTRSQADRIAGALPQQQKLLQNLEAQIATLQSLADKRDRAQAELKQKEKIRRFITFARKVYKEAGPRITERYVQSISREADRLFRELLKRQNVALEWTRDYEILVQEGAHTRRFLNLSGGEQMCAALAVRLALLRVLADIDVAFFDEPTTNMDRPRRESLAEAIAGIRSFRQLFVISHDDTFEKVTENVILVEREV